MVEEKKAKRATDENTKNEGKTRSENLGGKDVKDEKKCARSKRREAKENLGVVWADVGKMFGIRGVIACY